MIQSQYRLRIRPGTVRLIRTLHPVLKKKVRKSLSAIVENALCGKALKDELEGLMSFRVSRLRIIYRIRGKREIDIITIGPRKRIYEETYRLVRKDRRKYGGE